MDESTYRYDMSFPDQQVKITARLLVLENNVVEFKVTDIKGGRRLQSPHHIPWRKQLGLCG